MKGFKKLLVPILVLSSLASLQAQAHGRYILPSHTQLSGEATAAEPRFITLSASISNDLFHPDRALGNNPVCHSLSPEKKHCNKGVVPKRLSKLFSLLDGYMLTPSGAKQTVNWQAFARYSVADAALVEKGTYKLVLAQPAVPMITYKKKDGTSGRGIGPMAKAPEGATDIVRRASQSRVETYISFNENTDSVLKAQGQGLELVADSKNPGSHPNDLFVGEPQYWQLRLNDKPLTQPAELKIIRGGTRHRDLREPLEITTDKTGRFSTEFSKAGFYWLEAELEVEATDTDKIDVRNYGLYQTWEVFAE